MATIKYRDDDDIILKYEGFPLIQSMLREEHTRSKAHLKSGAFIAKSVKGNASWLRTIFVCRERAIDVIWFPWLIITLNATLWTLLLRYIPALSSPEDVLPSDMFTTVYPLILTTCLSFLLVFRLNRAAVRWWDTRRMWGVIIEQSRIIVSGIVEHMEHSPNERDRAVAWVCGFMIGSKAFLRGDVLGSEMEDELAGILDREDLARLVRCVVKGNHPGLYAAGEIRHAIKVGLGVCATSEKSSISLVLARESQMRQLETHIANLIASVGGMERIRSTPLPTVYVTHLRTFLFAFLFFMPYIYGHVWGWWTIPAVCLIGYALLGVDGAAAECESPFRQNRVNHLAMDAYCALGIKNVLQLMMDSADRYMRDHNIDCENDVEKGEL